MLEQSSVTLWTVEADGSGIRQRTPDGEGVYAPMWSSDGTLIAYNMNGGGGSGTCTPEIRVLDVSTGTISFVGSPAAAVGWSQDGRSLYAEWQRPLPDAPLGGVVIVRLDGSVERLLVPYEAADRVEAPCLWYGVFSKSYRGPRS